MKPIVFNQDIRATIKHNYVKLVSTVDHPEMVNQHTTILTPVQVGTVLDIDSKEFWELVKRAAIGLRINSTNTKQQEISMVVAEAAIAIQNTMDE